MLANAEPRKEQIIDLRAHLLVVSSPSKCHKQVQGFGNLTTYLIRIGKHRVPEAVIVVGDGEELLKLRQHRL